MSSFIANKNILDFRGYGVPKDSLTPEELKKHKKALSFKPLQISGYDFKPTKTTYMFRESPKRLWLPKFYGIHHFGTPAKNEERTGKTIDAEFEGSLKPEQQKILDSILPKIIKLGGGSLCLPTGFGKTVCAIWLACKLGVKTLWVTHKTNLMEQTRQRFESFTGETVGTIQQKKTDVNHPFVIGMLQSIAMRDYDKDLFDDFGLVIFDEAHHVPSYVFSKCLWKLNTRYMIGLSATLERKDQMTDVLEVCIGPVLVKIEAQLKIPIIKRIKAIYDDDNQRIEHVNSAGKADTAKLISDTVQDSKRNSIIIQTALAAQDEGRTVLILSERISHCNFIHSKIKYLLADKNEKNDNGTAEDLSVGLYIGGKKKEELEIANECNIIVGTYNMCAEGYDNPKLNTVIFATSKRDITQAAGRVLGLRSGGGFRPMIIDIYDTWGPARNQAYSRLKWYKDSNFEIHGANPLTHTDIKEKYKPTSFSIDDD